MPRVPARRNLHSGVKVTCQLKDGLTGSGSRNMRHISSSFLTFILPYQLFIQLSLAFHRLSIKLMSPFVGSMDLANKIRRPAQAGQRP